MSQDKLQDTTEEIIDKYADMVYRVALNETGNPQDAQDVFQEVFLRLVRYRDRITSEEHLKPWLIRVTINCSRKIKGSSWNKKVDYFDTETEEDTIDTNGNTAFLEIEKKDSPLSAAVNALPTLYREIIYMFYYEEMSILEICEILGEKESTVKSRLHRGREMLKIKLEGEELL